MTTARARAAANRLRAEVAEHASQQSCGSPDCLFHACFTCRHPLNSAAHHAECVAPLDQVVGGEG